MSDQTDPHMRQQFVDGMSYVASTVNVVTTDGPAGRAGVTVSAMSSVSADGPAPTLLVCVHHKSPAAAAIVENGVFCVNVLREDQSFISNTFAGIIKTGDGDKFSCTEWETTETGAPRVREPMVAFDCRMLSGERVGTHHVFVGEVAEIFHSRRGSPLIFSNRAYGSATRIDSELAHPPTGDDAPRLKIGCYNTFGPFFVPAMIKQMVSEQGALDLHLVEGDEYRIEKALKSDEVDIAFMFDYDLGEEIQREVVGEVNPYVLLAKGHPMAAQGRITPAELVDHPWVLLDVPSSRDYFISLFSRESLTPDIAWRARSFEMVRGMVGHGFGFALLCTNPSASMSYDGQALVTRELVTDAEPNRVVLATHRGSKLPPIAESFASRCRRYFNN